MIDETLRWLLKVIQPARTLSSLPGGAALSSEAHAALLGLPSAVYTHALAQMRAEAHDAADALLRDTAIAARVDALSLRKGARVAIVGDSLTSDPQSWAVILERMLQTRRAMDELTVSIVATGGDTTTHALVRLGEVIGQQPDVVLLLIGTNDARTQGPRPSKTLVHHEETARNLAEIQQRIASETRARAVWIAPPAANEAQVADHPGLARFGVRFRNEDLARVASLVRAIDPTAADLFAALGAPPAAEWLMSDGLHLTVAGQQRVALEALAAWSHQP